MKKFLLSIWSVFAVSCPHCGKILLRGRSEDPLFDYQHTCYKCGVDFVEGGDGLE